MSLDDRLNHAGERLNAKLDRVMIPATPQTMKPWWRPAAVTAVLVLVVGGLLLWISRSDEIGGDVAEEARPTPSTQMQGFQPNEVAPEGPQLADGDGWRYLAEYDRSTGVQSQIVASDNALGELWSGLDASEPVPMVDFGSEIVVAFQVGYSGNCPETRFDGVEVTDNIVELVVVDPTIRTGPPRVCQLGYMPRTYVVALSRGLLPSPPFTIKTSRNGAADITVVADLRLPGSDIEA
jgi:hypothetical protein